MLTNGRGSHGCLERRPRDEERRTGFAGVNQFSNFRQKRFNTVGTWLTILDGNVVDPSGRVHDQFITPPGRKLVRRPR
jgi:hypothetical protein